MIKPISEWKYILVDTSIIIDLIGNPEKFDNQEQRRKIEFAHNLFDYFRDSSNNEIRVYISAITYSELRKFPEDTINITDYVHPLMPGCLINDVDFTKDMAIHIFDQVKVTDIHPHLNKLIKTLADELNPQNVHCAKGIVSDDLKIIATAKYYHKLNKLDAVLTSDKKTFVPLAHHFNIPVIFTPDLPVDLHNAIDTSVYI